MHIERNLFNRQIITENLEGNIDDTPVYLTNIIKNGKYFVLSGLSDSYLESFYYTATLNEDSGKTKDLLLKFIETVICKYQLALNVDKNVKIIFQGTEYDVIPEDKNYLVSDHNWTIAYMAALACRDMESVHKMCEIDLDAVGAKTNTTGGVYSLLFAKFLQRFFNKAEPHGKNLLAAANEIKEDKMPDSTYDYALYIIGPLIDMYNSILFNKKEEFNQNLLTALKNHKTYWSRKQENLPEGLVSLPITGLCVMAKDYNFPVEHTSDYIITSLL